MNIHRTPRARRCRSRRHRTDPAAVRADDDDKDDDDDGRTVRGTRNGSSWVEFWDKKGSRLGTG